MTRGGASPRDLRAWLEYVAATAIDMLDNLDAQAEGLEDDERECDRESAA